MKLQMLIYSSLCIAANLLFTQCPKGPEYQWGHCCSMDIYNHTGYPVALHMNFDPQSGNMYKFGDIRYVIATGSLCGLVEHRYYHIYAYGDHYDYFDSIWETPNNEPVYCKLYRVNPDTYKEEELLAEWDSSQPDESSFFNEKTWRHESDYDETTVICFHRWTFRIDEYPDGVQE